VAIEVQTSSITSADLARRHARYTEVGIQCVWLLAKASGHVATQDRPVFQITRAAEGIFVDHLPGSHTAGPVLLQDFVDKLLSDLVRWTPWLGDEIPLQLWTAKERCRSGLHAAKQIDKALLILGSTWPGMSDVEYRWPGLSMGSRANELMAVISQLPFTAAGVARPRRQQSSLGLFYSQGCEVCGKSSWGAQRQGIAVLCKSVTLKASSTWARSRNGDGFPCQWWWGERSAPARAATKASAGGA
jgi:hypothetical protein